MSSFNNQNIYSVKSFNGIAVYIVSFLGKSLMTC